MQNPILFAFGSMIFYGLADWLYKQVAIKGIKPHHFMALQATFFMPSIFTFGYFSNDLHFDLSYLFGLGAGLGLFLALYNFSISLNEGAVSIAAPIFRLSFIFTVVLAVITLNEPINSLKIAAFLLCFVAIWLLLGNTLIFKEKNGMPYESHISKKGLFRVLLATFFMGLTSFIYKLGILAGGTPISVVCGQATTFFPCAYGFALARDKGFTVPLKYWYFGVAAAFTQLAAQILLLKGLINGEASVLIPIAQMGFVITAILGIVFLRERLTMSKVFGLSATVLAFVCLALS